jgi:hypothetical protein
MKRRSTISRRTAFLTTLASVMLLGVGVAGASHVPVIDPALVPPGFLAAHVDVADFQISPFARAIQDHRADVFVQHFQVAPNGALPWHTHPGPAIVAVVRGELGYQQEVNGECVTTWYPAGTGFVDPGFGHVHRGLGGPEGFDAYTTFVIPSGSPSQTIPAPAPEACS